MNGIQPMHFLILFSCCYLMAKYFAQAKDYVFLVKETIQTKTQSGSGKTTATSSITSSISDDLYNTPHGTLMIPRGLYDVPWIHKPATTVLENNEVPIDYLPFHSRCGQYRLEFLPVQVERLFSTFKTF